MASLSPGFLDELRARTPIAALIGRSVRLTRSGREHKGCCPFHGEKSPSFYVYDDHFHCFGCGEHGDAITFVMKSTGAAFMEAVERLAAEAGLDVPKASPQAAEAEQKRAGIAEILEAAAAQYQKWLFEPQGAAALDYLRGRGLTDATIQKFGLGWSGEGRGQLATALAGQGIMPAQLVEAGLMKAGDRGPVDMFFSRVMFPIADRRGQKISFGGRILGDGQPKYVNGPETTAFSKRRSLYGLNSAREAVRKGEALIVVEGYMDVIALAQAGFGGAVAPLGTALTEEQLGDLWRLSPAPTICFDADAAGRRAALRTVDLALASLTPDQSLKFLRLPEGQDPDSMVRGQGAAAFKTQLDAAQQLSTVLFDMLAEGVARKTPEAQAAFRIRLADAANRIQDKTLSSEYRNLLLNRFFAERRTPRTKPSSRVATPPVSTEAADEIRGAILTAILLDRPEIFPDVEEAFAQVKLPESCRKLRSALSDFSSSQTLDNKNLLTHLSELGLHEAAFNVAAVAARHYRIDPGLSLADAAQNWWSWYLQMSFSIEMLSRHKLETQDFWLRHPQDNQACARFIKYTDLLRLALAGEHDCENAS